jgi:hypothetical protein
LSAALPAAAAALDAGRVIVRRPARSHRRSDAE